MQLPSQCPRHFKISDPGHFATTASNPSAAERNVIHEEWKAVYWGPSHGAQSSQIDYNAHSRLKQNDQTPIGGFDTIDMTGTQPRGDNSEATPNAGGVSQNVNLGEADEERLTIPRIQTLVAWMLALPAILRNQATKATTNLPQPPTTKIKSCWPMQPPRRSLSIFLDRRGTPGGIATPATVLWIQPGEAVGVVRTANIASI